MIVKSDTRPTTPASNVLASAGRTVHRGTWVRRFGKPGEWIESQACGMSPSQHAYGFPVDMEVTCKRCLKSVTA